MQKAAFPIDLVRQSIERLMAEHGDKPKPLAAALGFGETGVRDIFLQKTKSIGSTKLSAIASHYGVTVEEILSGEATTEGRSKGQEGPLPQSNGIVKKLEGAPDIHLPRDLPVYGSSLGAPRDFDGKAIEQTMLNTANVVDHIKRPAILHGQNFAYALWVQGVSMEPRYEDGDTIYVTNSLHAKPPRIHDDVVVYIRDMEEDDGLSATGVLVKRLVRRTASYVELQQFNPPETFRIPADRVLRMDRVIPWREIIA